MLKSLWRPLVAGLVGLGLLIASLRLRLREDEQKPAPPPPAPVIAAAPAQPADALPPFAERARSLLLHDGYFVSPASALVTPEDCVEKALAPHPPVLDRVHAAGISLALIRGGHPASCCSPLSRSVSDFIEQTNSVAGINGTFFDFHPTGRGKNYRDRVLIGPWMTGDDATFHPEKRPYLLPRLRNRPLIIWGKTRCAIFPFQPETMNDYKNLQAVMPDVTDVFLCGAWLVRDGKARTAEQLSEFAVSDVNTPRFRAFVGLMPSGDFVMGATLVPTTSQKLSKSLVALNLQEAVLLDSGMSTCLIYNGQQVAFGHANHRPSRIIPHAICLLPE